MSKALTFPEVPDGIIGRIGDVFQQATKHHPRRYPGSWEEPRPGSFPADPRYLPAEEVITLPEVDWEATLPLLPAIRQRRSVREYAAEPLALTELSILIAAALGVTARWGGEPLLACPSAGAMYPLELYAVVNRVEGLTPGIGRYRPEGHRLVIMARGDFRREIAEACLGQEMAGEAGAVVVWTAVVERSRRRYGQRCYRYLHLEAGHSAQNLLLAATALGLGACAIGAYFDDPVNRIVRADGIEETAIYLVSVGNR